MKSFFFLIISFLVITSTAKSQQNMGQRIAAAVAQKMADSLGLTGSQKQQVYNINMQLLGQKTSARAQHPSNNELETQIQNIENGRDSLYKAVVGNEKFTLYKRNKIALITARP